MAWQNTPVGDYRSKPGTVDDRPRGAAGESRAMCSIGNVGPKAGSAVTHLCSKQRIPVSTFEPDAGIVDGHCEM
jgi:hypothetical protein